MATEGDKSFIKRPERNTDPAEQQGDADAGSRNQVDGYDMDLASDLSGGQTAGSKNVRANEYDGVKHDTEPYGQDQAAGAPQKDFGHTVGITSKKLTEELGADAYVKPHHSTGNEGAFGDDEREKKVEPGDLPSAKAERVETVNVQAGTVNK